MRTADRESRGRPRVVITPWGTVIEDYLEPLGRTLADFRERITGGWMFNYVRALQLAEVDPTILVVSRAVRRVEHGFHEPTGVPFVTMPSTSIARLMRRGQRRQYGGQHAVAEPSDVRQGVTMRNVLREAARYLSTPPTLLARILRQLGAGAVLCQEYEWERFDVLVRLGRRLDLPVFGVFQGGSGNRGVLSRAFRATSVRMSSGLMIGSRREAERVRADYGVPATAIGHFLNPFGLDEVVTTNREAARADAGIPANAFVVAWHGRVDVHAKGLDVLARAWERFTAERTPAPGILLILGSGPHDANLRELLGPRLHDGSVRWINEYLHDRARVYHYLSAANVHAFPSRHEGFPVAPIEAMAVGLALVAGQAHGLDEIAPRGEADGAVRVPGEDPDALAAALLALARDPGRVAKLGMAARQRAAAGFALEPIGRAMRDWMVARGLRATHA